MWQTMKDLVWFWLRRRPRRPTVSPETRHLREVLSRFDSCICSIVRQQGRLKSRQRIALDLLFKELRGAREAGISAAEGLNEGLRLRTECCICEGYVWAARLRGAPEEEAFHCSKAAELCLLWAVAGLSANAPMALWRKCAELVGLQQCSQDDDQPDPPPPRKPWNILRSECSVLRSLLRRVSSETRERLTTRGTMPHPVVTGFLARPQCLLLEGLMVVDEESPAPEADKAFPHDLLTLVFCQRLFPGEEVPGKWTLFLKVDGQLGPDSSVSIVRLPVGGAYSVRGYHENEADGDQLSARTLELCTPLIHNFILGLINGDTVLAMNGENLQENSAGSVPFTDTTRVGGNAPLVGEGRNEDMNNADPESRLGFTKYAQMRSDCDLCFQEPVDDIEATVTSHSSCSSSGNVWEWSGAPVTATTVLISEPGAGCRHFSLQLQF